MTNFIQRTNTKADLNLMLQDFEAVISAIGWPKKVDAFGRTLSSNQIGLTHRPGAEDQSLDNVGSLFGQIVAKESEFSEFNDLLGSYTRNAIMQLCKDEGIEVGRIRYMKLQEKTGLTVHKDSEVRYHFVLKTNPNAFFGEKVEDSDLAAKCYHIPADGCFYKVDTTRDHFVYNGSRSDRIHLVICTL